MIKPHALAIWVARAKRFCFVNERMTRLKSGAFFMSSAIIGTATSANSTRKRCDWNDKKAVATMRAAGASGSFRKFKRIARAASVRRIS